MNGRDYELIAQQVSGLNEQVATLAARVAEADRVMARLEAAALTTARALQEISRHWDAVYEAMRREEERDEASEDLRREQSRTPSREGD